LGRHYTTRSSVDTDALCISGLSGWDGWRWYSPNFSLPREACVCIWPCGIISTSCTGGEWELGEREDKERYVPSSEVVAVLFVRLPWPWISSPDAAVARRAWFLIVSILILSPSTSLIHIFFPSPPFTLSPSRCNGFSHSRCSSSPDAASFALRFAPHPTGCSLGHCATAGDGEEEERARWSAGGGCDSCRRGPRW
jgi:hypothetical protein